MNFFFFLTVRFTEIIKRNASTYIFFVHNVFQSHYISSNFFRSIDFRSHVFQSDHPDLGTIYGTGTIWRRFDPGSVIDSSLRYPVPDVGAPLSWHVISNTDIQSPSKVLSRSVTSTTSEENDCTFSSICGIES